jgi:hypothetical protein
VPLPVLEEPGPRRIRRFCRLAQALHHDRASEVVAAARAEARVLVGAVARERFVRENAVLQQRLLRRVVCLVERLVGKLEETVALRGQGRALGGVEVVVPAQRVMTKRQISIKIAASTCQQQDMRRAKRRIIKRRIDLEASSSRRIFRATHFSRDAFFARRIFRATHFSRDAFFADAFFADSFFADAFFARRIFRARRTDQSLNEHIPCARAKSGIAS